MDELLRDRYRVLRQIGSGGMAAVFEGEDTSLGRKIAVKILHPQYVADESFVARFEREARAIAGLKHPSIVDVYDIGQDNGRYFIIMEFVDGQSVKDLVKAEGALPPAQVIDVGIQIGKALEYAHRAGVIHRDVKSHNILVSADGATKLVDFGIAVAKGSAQVTEAGTVLGSVHYIAPEQARGETAIPASDIYSLGVVLYEIASGRLPFEGDTPIEIASKQVSERPTPPSALNPRIPGGLERAILHALAKDPRDRPEDAGALVRELLEPSDEPADEQTRVVRATTNEVHRPPPVRPPAPKAAKPAVAPWATVVEEPSSATWPIYALVILAAVLVLGLVPLWSAALRGG